MPNHHSHNKYSYNSCNSCNSCNSSNNYFDRKTYLHVLRKSAFNAAQLSYVHHREAMMHNCRSSMMCNCRSSTIEYELLRKRSCVYRCAYRL